MLASIELLKHEENVFYYNNADVTIIIIIIIIIIIVMQSDGLSYRILLTFLFNAKTVRGPQNCCFLIASKRC